MKQRENSAIMIMELPHWMDLKVLWVGCQISHPEMSIPVWHEKSICKYQERESSSYWHKPSVKVKKIYIYIINTYTRGWDW